jgi:hypothetical protein
LAKKHIECFYKKKIAPAKKAMVVDRQFRLFCNNNYWKALQPIIP